MNVFADSKNLQTAFLALKRRRKSEHTPKWNVFGEVLEDFGPLFAKSALLFAKIERNGEVLEDFEKDRVFSRCSTSALNSIPPFDSNSILYNPIHNFPSSQ